MYVFVFLVEPLCKINIKKAIILYRYIVDTIRKAICFELNRDDDAQKASSYEVISSFGTWKET